MFDCVTFGIRKTSSFLDHFYSLEGLAACLRVVALEARFQVVVDFRFEESFSGLGVICAGKATSSSGDKGNV